MSSTAIFKKRSGKMITEVYCRLGAEMESRGVI